MRSITIAIKAAPWNSLFHMQHNELKHLGDIALFVEVARSRSFRTAAAALGMPGSTLSRRITALERAFGVRLLNRTTRRVELTEAGQLYFERGRRIVDEARVAHEALTGFATQPGGTIRVSAPVDFARVFLVPHLPAFCARYPAINFDIDLTPARIDLIADPFDVAIRMGALPDSRLIARKLADIPRNLYASRAYLDANGDPAQPDDLSRHQCLLLPWESRWTFGRGTDIRAVTVGSRFRLNNIGMMQDLAMQGLGIAMLSRRGAAADVAAGRLVPVLDGWSPPPIPVHAVTETRLLPERIERFIDFLKSCVNDDTVSSIPAADKDWGDAK